MNTLAQSRHSVFDVSASNILLRVVLVLSLLIMTSHLVLGQTYRVIYNFTGGADGSVPESGLTADNAGNFYGTTVYGGNPHCGLYGCGVVFKLVHSVSGWNLNPLYSFAGIPDGMSPYGRVAIGRDGSLYGTTHDGGRPGCGSNPGCGTVFQLIPGRTVRATWSDIILYRFTGGSDGGSPQGDLTFDGSGKIYGTAFGGGPGGYDNYGAIYQLSPSDNSWTFQALYSPADRSHGVFPSGGVVLDGFGNLYGVFFEGGSNGWGEVYQLSPSQSGWTLRGLYGFDPYGSEGAYPYGAPILDSSGNLYGTTQCGGTGGGGTIFELSPNTVAWGHKTLYNFYPGGCNRGPYGRLVMDAAGNLYGTTQDDGAYLCGSVFKLSRSNEGWTYTALHDFTCGDDGDGAGDNIVVDGQGNVYGTAFGGPLGFGLVFEITR